MKRLRERIKVTVEIYANSGKRANEIGNELLDVMRTFARTYDRDEEARVVYESMEGIGVDTAEEG